MNELKESTYFLLFSRIANITGSHFKKSQSAKEIPMHLDFIKLRIFAYESGGLWKSKQIVKQKSELITNCRSLINAANRDDQHWVNSEHSRLTPHTCKLRKSTSDQSKVSTVFFCFISLSQGHNSPANGIENTHGWQSEAIKQSNVVASMRIQAGFLIGLVFCLLSHGVLTGISYQLGPKVSYRCRLCCNVVKWSKQKWVKPGPQLRNGSRPALSI